MYVTRFNRIVNSCRASPPVQLRAIQHPVCHEDLRSRGVHVGRWVHWGRPSLPKPNAWRPRMKRRHFIGVDVHCKFLELAVVDAEGRKVLGGRCATTIPALVAELDKVPRPRALVI